MSANRKSVWVVLVPDPDAELGAYPLVFYGDDEPSRSDIQALLDENEWEGSVDPDDCHVYGRWIDLG